MDHNHSRTSSSLHLWIMLACCLIPLALILAIGAFGISLGSLTLLLPYAMILLCPLMMFFMMRSMGHDHDMGDGHHVHAPRASAIPHLESGRDSARRTGIAASGAASGLKKCH